MFLFISGAEIVFIFFIILLVFGADKIPSIAKTVAKGVMQVRKATNEIRPASTIRFFPRKFVVWIPKVAKTTAMASCEFSINSLFISGDIALCLWLMDIT